MVRSSWSESSSSSLPSTSHYYISNNQSIIQKTRLDDKIESATINLQQYFANILKKQSNQNTETISDCVIAIIIEVNPTIQHNSGHIPASNPAAIQGKLLNLSALASSSRSMQVLVVIIEGN